MCVNSSAWTARRETAVFITATAWKEPLFTVLMFSLQSPISPDMSPSSCSDENPASIDQFTLYADIMVLPQLVYLTCDFGHRDVTSFCVNTFMNVEKCDKFGSGCKLSNVVIIISFSLGFCLTGPLYLSYSRFGLFPKWTTGIVGAEHITGQVLFCHQTNTEAIVIIITITMYRTSIEGKQIKK